MARKIYSTILAKPTQSILKLIITITISSSVIGASAALYFPNYSVQLWSGSVIGQLAVIGHR